MILPTTFVVPYDVCDTSILYDEKKGFVWSLPESDLKGYLSGMGFDNKTPYDPKVQKDLQDDIRDIFQEIMNKNPEKKKTIIVTCGAPGAGKTYVLRKILLEKENGRVAYVCPDDVCLKGMKRTFDAAIQARDQSKEKTIDQSKAERLAIYNHFRPGSNAALNLMLGNLIREGYSIAYGTTASSPHTWKSFEFWQKQGYTDIRLIYVIAPDEVRWQSIKNRDKEFLQTTEKDVKDKGKLVAQRINDTYLKYASQIKFLYRDSTDSDATWTATWIRTNDPKEEIAGELKIEDPKMYDEMVRVFNENCNSLPNANELRWENSVLPVSRIIQ